MMTIYPEFIAPLFDKYTPLPDSELRKKIEALAAKLAFPLTKLYVVEGQILTELVSGALIRALNDEKMAGPRF